MYALGQGPDGRPFYAMRFVKGDSLKQAIEDFHRPDNPNRKDPGARQLALRQLLGRFIDVCNAMEYAHSRGVLHRDLKPGNIMVGKVRRNAGRGLGSGQIGRARKRSSRTKPTLRPSSALSSSGQTQPGSAIGTPAYMSPEQAAGKLEELGPASDVYSLGATLYHVLCGRPPFEKEEHSEILAKVQRGDFPKPRSVVHEVPAALEAICLKAMALKPADRYQTARSLADDLEHWLADEPVTAAPDTFNNQVSRLARKHRGYVRAGAVAVIVIAIVSVVAAIQINRSREAALELAGKNERLAERNGQLAENETKARQRAEGFQRESVEKTLDAYDSLAQAALAQSRALANAKQLGRQAAALEALKQAGSLRRKSLDLVNSLDDAAEGQASHAASNWSEYLPLLRGEAARWLTQTSLQNVKMHAFPTEHFHSIALSPDGSTLASFVKGEIRVIDVASGAVKASLLQAEHLFPRRHENAVAMSKDGLRIVICSVYGEIGERGWKASAIEIQSRSFPDLNLITNRKIVVGEEFDRNFSDFFDWRRYEYDRFLMGDDLQFLIASTGRKTIAWETDTGRQVYHDAEFHVTSINRRGSVMVGLSPSNGVRIVEIDCGAMRELAQPDKVAWAWISPNARHLILDLADRGNEHVHRLQLVDAATGKSPQPRYPTRTIRDMEQTPCVRFIPTARNSSPLRPRVCRWFRFPRAKSS